MATPSLAACRRWTVRCRRSTFSCIGEVVAASFVLAPTPKVSRIHPPFLYRTSNSSSSWSCSWSCSWCWCARYPECTYTITDASRKNPAGSRQMDPTPALFFLKNIWLTKDPQWSQNKGNPRRFKGKQESNGGKCFAFLGWIFIVAWNPTPKDPERSNGSTSRRGRDLNQSWLSTRWLMAS